jgi:hypothetical protein
MGQGGYLHAELDGAGPFSLIKMHTVPLELFILKVLKKRGRDNDGSARSNTEYKNNHIEIKAAK